MKAVMAFLLLALAACGGVNDATVTGVAPTLDSSAADVNNQPTPAEFAVSETEVVTQIAAPGTTTAIPSEAAPTLAAQAVETVDVASLPAGSFQVTVTGSHETTFDSSSVYGVADYVPESGILNFQLGDDASANPAEQVSITLPGGASAGTYAIAGTFGDTPIQGNAGAIYDTGAVDDPNALYGTNTSGAVTITGAGAEHISGYFTFSAENPEARQVTVSGVFNRIEKNPASD